MGDGKKKVDQQDKRQVKSPGPWSIKDDQIAAMKRSANKYSLLGMINNNDVLKEDERSMKMRIVDRFLIQKKCPTEQDIRHWDRDMKDYFDVQRKA